MKKHPINKAAGQLLSMQQYSRNFFAGGNCVFNDQILSALLIIWVRQSEGIQTLATDVFTQPGVSDRTRKLYIRLMVQRGFLNPVSPGLSRETILCLSNDAQDRFRDAEDFNIAK